MPWPGLPHPPAVPPLADDPGLLLELALAGGGSLDVDRTCREFLRLLVERGQAEVAAIWRREGLPAQRVGERAPAEPGWSTHFFPPDAVANAEAPDRRRLSSSSGSRTSLAAGWEASFRAPGRDAGGGESFLLVFTLADVGVLEVLRRRDRTGAEADLRALRPVAGQLAASIRGGLAWAALQAIEPRADADAAAERERLRGEIASDLRHALRNPLTAVLGFTELLKRRNLPAAKRAELLALLAREALHLNEILEGRR